MFSQKRKQTWSRLIACATLGLYLIALVIMPALHRHDCEHAAEICCEHSESPPHPTPHSDDSCPICEFALLAVPYLTVSEPLLWQSDIVSELFFTDSILSVAYVTTLPPCRAPPVI